MTGGAGNLAAGWIFLCLTALGCGTAAPFVLAAAGRLESPTLETIAQGRWPVDYESALAKTLPAGTYSRNFWGRAEYAVFHDGRSGVVPGADGWFFTAEEFSCPVHVSSNISANLGFIGDIRTKLAARNTALAVILIPAKARVYAGQLDGTAMPGCRQGLYDEVIDFFNAQKIPAVRMLPTMLAKRQRENLYLRADTHWSPAGARLAATETARIVSAIGLDLDRQDFSTQDGKPRAHAGDLGRYLYKLGSCRERQMRIA